VNDLQSLVMRRPPCGPASQGFTVDDLASVPDDGRRYELVDGSLVVTPAPNKRHQLVVLELYETFKAAAPAGLHVVVAPYEWRPAPDTAFQPDVLVCSSAADLAYETEPPLIVAEVLSPSTRSFDLLLKRDRYQREGVGAYWIVDAAVPSITVVGRRGGEFVVVAAAEGDEEVIVDTPFPVRLRPSDLLA
jgi:Uma2 family endonuclease